MLSPRIESALEMLRLAQDRAVETISAVQSDCPHRDVLFSPYANAQHPRRICTRCRLEETGSFTATEDHWPGMYVARQTQLHNAPGRNVRLATREQVEALRINLGDTK